MEKCVEKKKYLNSEIECKKLVVQDFIENTS